MRLQFTTALLAAALVALPATAAAPHSNVIASSPADGATLARPRTLSLTFDAPMPPSAVATSIVMTAMPGMADHPPMTIRNFQTGWTKDSRTITLTLAKPLVAGTYDLRWQAAGADGHRMTGKISFTVR